MLEALPTELLHSVCRYLPCFSILSLCFTSRVLYASCYDRLIFKSSAIGAIFEDRYDNLPQLDDVHVEAWELQSCASEASAEKSEDEEWWPDFEEENMSPQDDWDMQDWGPDAMQRIATAQQEWYKNWPESLIFELLSAADSARIALAVEKAELYFNVSIADQLPTLTHSQRESRELVQWLPRLLALHHRSAILAQPEILHLLLWDPDDVERLKLESDYPARNPSPTGFTAAAFSIAALMLVRMEAVPRRRPTDSVGSPIDI
ncbi:hypothetical protein K458DRAFT_430050 [Lentithecium fluviatile CBS 122367]|uniref:F-box domain-containing protein n=1 Tax=Lentithecium fluviatile CBS 122367 TaxID=1168545 RepID=A0A6G1J7K5_9PLEO|nr:hypothetical protein K458DRAFT_430050 [Lentithecium fluviatile CBS 122367]